MFRLAIKQWSITVGLIWALLMISFPSTAAAQENIKSEWQEHIKYLSQEAKEALSWDIKLSQEAMQVLSTWKNYLTAYLEWNKAKREGNKEEPDLLLKVRTLKNKYREAWDKWDTKMKEAISSALSEGDKNYLKLRELLERYTFDVSEEESEKFFKKYDEIDAPVIWKLETTYFNMAGSWRGVFPRSADASDWLSQLFQELDRGGHPPDDFFECLSSMKETEVKLREAELYILQAHNQAIKDVLAGKRARYFIGKNLEMEEKNVVTEDAIQFLNPYPSDGARFSPEKTKSFRSTITYSLASEDRGIIKVRAVAILEGEIQKTIGEKDIPVTKGQNKKTEIKLPLNIPEKAEKLIFSAKLILEKEGDIGVYDEISATPWIPANVELIVPGDPIIANGRGTYSFKVKVMQRGKPLEGAKIEIWPQASPYPFMTDAEIVGSSGGILHLTTDASGMTEFYYKPPKVLPEKLPRFPREKAFTYPLLVKAPGLAESKVWDISLYPPHPRIKSLQVSELSAGDWQKAESIVEVEDPDSTFFIYTILFNGNIGWKEGHDNFKKLVADGEKLFAFRLKPIKFGTDLQDLPSLYEKLWETNKQFIINEIFSLGALRLKKAEVFENLVEKLKKTKLILDVKGPAKDLKGTAELWGKTAEEVGKESLSMKNASDAIGVYIKGYNTTVGVVDYVDSWLDTGPYDPYSTALKLIYENAKTFYDVFEAHRKVAEAYEDVIFLPILVKVKDADGYSDIKIKKVVVRFWKR